MGDNEEIRRAVAGQQDSMKSPAFEQLGQELAKVAIPDYTQLGQELAKVAIPDYTELSQELAKVAIPDYTELGRNFVKSPAFERLGQQLAKVAIPDYTELGRNFVKSPAFEQLSARATVRAALLTDRIQQNPALTPSLRNLASEQFGWAAMLEMSQDSLSNHATFVPTDEQWDRMAEQFTELAVPSEDADVDDPDAVNAEMQQAIDEIFADIEPLLEGNHELEAVQAHLQTRYGAETCRWLLVGFVGMLWGVAYYTISLTNPDAMSLIMDTTGMDLKSTLVLGYLAATTIFPYPNSEE